MREQERCQPVRKLQPLRDDSSLSSDSDGDGDEGKCEQIRLVTVYRDAILPS